MIEKYGSFSHIEKQPKGEPDAISDSGYAIDFKLLISPSMSKFRNTTKPRKIEIFPGIRTTNYPEPCQATVVSLFNALRGMNDDLIKDIRQNDDEISKDIVHFFDKVISKNKNILLFNPLYLNTVDKTLSIENRQSIINDEIYSCNRYIYEYRDKNFAGFDTYIVYIENFTNSWSESMFVIARFTEKNLEIIDRVQLFSLDSIKKLYDINF